MEKNHFSPNDIYNADETGCTTVQKVGNTKVIACRNEKQVGKITPGERRTSVTMITPGERGTSVTMITPGERRTSVTMITPGERRTSVTMLGAINAAGNSIPPF